MSVPIEYGVSMDCNWREHGSVRNSKVPGRSRLVDNVDNDQFYGTWHLDKGYRTVNDGYGDCSQIEKAHKRSV